MEGLLEELFSMATQVPKVKKSGYSECPFAEDLYAYKEQAAAKVIEESKKLQPYLGLVEEEIARCRQNVDQLRTDADTLNLDEPKRRFAAAKQSQESRYNKAINQRKALIDLISRTEELLKLAKTEEWPGGKPKESFRPPALGGRTTGSSFNNEINSLISLGPLRR